jgi:hypothetical protein
MHRFRSAVCLLAFVCACAGPDTSKAPPGQEPEPDVGADTAEPVCDDFDRDGSPVGPDCEQVLEDCDDNDATRHPGAQEVCDGVDNDCDGAVDNGVVTGACALTLGVCAGSMQVCHPEAGLLGCGSDQYGKDWLEVEDGFQNEDHCDGLDNDCDGQTDEGCPCEGDETVLCGLGEGECERGLQHCVEGQFGPCEGAVEPGDELCDGLDNDCDGDFDEALPAPPCAAQLGVCVGAKQFCRGAAGWGSCGQDEYGERWAEVEDPELAEEVCDRLDNDCDGQTDEGCDCADGEVIPCGIDVGVCRPGTQTCDAGRFGDCRDAVEPATETCDGLDNDCDGTEDNDLTAPDCALQLGVCLGSEQVCAAEGGWVRCEGQGSYGQRYVPVEDPELEEGVCDGVDNDCDGQTDEGCDCLDGTVQSCGTNVGLCEVGRQICAGGRPGPCQGHTPPAGEVCDGFDNDCDAAVDEDVERPDCALGQGVCAGAKMRCGGRDGFLACAAEDYGPAYQEEESFCDRRDNDCDGEVDEGCDCVDGDIQRCGSDEGVCEAGSQTCVRGAWGTCVGEVQPDGEVCDGFDNDCDSLTDEVEDLDPPNCALTAGVCAGAAQECGGRGGFVACNADSYGPNFDQGDEVRCDGLDNNCNGEIDEQCECLPDDTQVCGSDVGACNTGVQSCVDGFFDACEGEVVPTEESCNGADDDCDGGVDEDLRVECPLQIGLCAGSVARCKEGAFPECGIPEYGAEWVAEEDARCDGLDNDCDGVVDEGCALPPVVISELLYDEDGEDAGMSLFLELSGTPGTSLGGLSLRAINGNGGAVSYQLQLPRVSLASDGAYLIVGSAASAVLADAADLVVDSVDLQNGPDSLELVWNEGTGAEAVVDAVGYGAFDDGDTFAGEGTAASDAPVGQSLTRDAGNVDTDDNGVDFVASGASAAGVPTPGGQPLPNVHVSLRWATDGNDLDLHVLETGATFRTAPGDCYFANRNPDWGVPDDASDDPSLLRDDVDGFGPEFTNIPQPANGSFLVEAHVWRTTEPVPATVTISVDGGGMPGVNEFTFTQALPATGTYWAVAEVVSIDGVLSVVTRDEVAESPFDGPSP